MNIREEIEKTLEGKIHIIAVDEEEAAEAREKINSIIDDLENLFLKYINNNKLI